MVAKMIALPADFMKFDGSQEHNSGLTVGNRRTKKICSIISEMAENQLRL